MFKVGDVVRIKSTANSDVTSRYNVNSFHAITKIQKGISGNGYRYFLGDLRTFWVFDNEIEIAKNNNRRNYV